MSELGKDARIEDLWRTASSVGISSKDPEEPMMMRLDEIGETRELQGGRWCHTRPTRPSKDGGIQKVMYVPLEITNDSPQVCQKMKNGKMLTRFEEGRCVTIVG